MPQTPSSLKREILAFALVGFLAAVILILTGRRGEEVETPEAAPTTTQTPTETTLEP